MAKRAAEAEAARDDPLHKYFPGRMGPAADTPEEFEKRDADAARDDPLHKYFPGRMGPAVD